MLEATDPNFHKQNLLEGGPLDIMVDESPCGPIRVVAFDKRGNDHGGTKIPDGGSAVVLPFGHYRVYLETPGRLSGYLPQGGYALVPGGTALQTGQGIYIYTPRYVGLPQIGGPVEPFGRLKYIDGCSDSLLISPSILGEPCLNHLHIPSGIHQSAHTHPSDRIGIILRGSGYCQTGTDLSNIITHPLTAGMFWRIPAGGVHSFHTNDDEALDVFAWHPDSDVGPAHDSHPMLTRTIVDGKPASDPSHSDIRTTKIRP